MGKGETVEIANIHAGFVYVAENIAKKWKRMNYSMTDDHAIRHASACMHSHKKLLTPCRPSYVEYVRAL